MRIKKRESDSKHAFWQAFVFTIIVFGTGLILGFFLESYRADKVQYILIDSEINILDNQLRERITSDFNLSCSSAIDSVFDFADQIFFEADKLERYDSASKFSDNLFVLHKRYDLLRTLLWLEAIDLKANCGKEADFHTVVYLYLYKSEDVDIDSKQLFYSRLLFDMKQKYPDKVLLIPIAVNTGLSSVELIVENYNLGEFPYVIVDEEKIVNEILTFDELENIVFENSK